MVKSGRGFNVSEVIESWHILGDSFFSGRNEQHVANVT